MRTGTLAVLSLLAVACARTVLTLTPFVPAEAAYIMEDGANTVEGSGFLRQRGGGVVTCAGETVSLIPQSAYARERVRNHFGTTERAARSLRLVRLDDPPLEYLAMLRETACDADGDFTFQNVPDGAYFVWTLVIWEAGGVPQGGAVMSPVQVSGGETVSLVVSP